MGIISICISLIIIILWLGWLSFHIIDLAESQREMFKSQLIVTELNRERFEKMGKRISDIERGLEDDGR